MSNEAINESRRMEISGKFVEMGKSLLQEGYDTSNPNVSQSGTIMILLAAVLMDEDDMLLFTELCSMFSAKKILLDLDGMQGNPDLVTMLRKKYTKAPAKTTRRKPKNGGENPPKPE